MNIAGLSLGIACALVIYKILDYELNYDKHHAQYDRIYRVNNEDNTTQGKVLFRGQTHPLGKALRDEFPSVEATMIYYAEEGMIAVESVDGVVHRFQERTGIAFVEPQFLNVFTLHFLAGNAETALDAPNKVIITASMATKYFGVAKEDVTSVLGQLILLENKQSSYVSGVVEDFPASTDFPFKVLFHYEDQWAANPWYEDGTLWSEYNSRTNCFLLLGEDVEAEVFEKQLVHIANKYLPAERAKDRTYKLQPLSDLHYSKEIRKNYGGITATKQELLVLGLVGLFLVVTACVNFINLSTAQAVKRSKEVGVRKTMGSGKRQLVVQFLCETFLITFFATLLGFFLAYFLGGQVEEIFDDGLTINLLDDPDVIYFTLFLIFGVTVLAGTYPSFILSRMNPVLAIKNSLNVKQASGFLSFRRSLVVIQFTISQVLIIGILILNAQMSFFQNKDLGFNDEAIVVVKLPQNDSTKVQVLKTELLAHSAIAGVSVGSSGPMASWNSTNPIFHPNIEGQDYTANLKTADEHFVELYEIKLIAGQPYKKGDPWSHAVVNRQMTRILGFNEPADALGEKVKFGRGSSSFTIVGVSEDFHANSLRGEIANVFIANVPWNIFQVSIKLAPGLTSYADMKEAINHIEHAWLTQFPEYVFDFDFYSERLDAIYNLERSVARIFQIFVTIAIIIGALGLYGLVSFISNQKTKEIGIRKVMGASEWSIWNIFSKELLALLLIAFLISAPVSYFLMQAFLNTYAHRITIGPQFFVLALFVSVLVALFTVGYKSFKAAKANPILSLRDE